MTCNGGLVQKLLAVVAVLLMAMPASATVVIDAAANDVVIARDAGQAATAQTAMAQSAMTLSAPSPSSIPAVDPFALAIPVLLVAILLLRGGRSREPRPVIA